MDQIILRVGDELAAPGLPVHKMVYVGPIGPCGEDVVNPAKGQAAHFVHFDLIPNKEQLRVVARGPEDWYAQSRVQARARRVVGNGVVNRTLGPNCEHICSYIRGERPESPQLKFWGGVAALIGLIFLLSD
ncbi:MAG: hypothetical protein WA817_23875 [Candidatus Acidiferrum sp.]